MYWFRALFSLAVCIASTIALNSHFGDIPALGKFLDPFAGFWNNAEYGQPQGELTISVDGDINSTVYFDEEDIPHIYADDEYSLYFTQGYVTARHRLWQIDFQSRAGSGTLSEVLGERALEYDRYQRRIGMPFGATTRHNKMMSDPKMSGIATAYVNGINAWIDQLSPKDYPLEYKILGYSPKKLTTMDIAYLLMSMSYSLSARNFEKSYSQAFNKLGKKDFEALFPGFTQHQDPIVPEDEPFNFTADVPQPPKEAFIPSFISTDSLFQPNPNNGSNNWVVAGIKTLSGHPILANDPHLNLTLPSIWYMTHLVMPDMNVFGVTFPGAPTIVLGVNEHIAWGTTNTGADVMDWYEIKFRDKKKHQYWYENQWVETTKYPDTIYVKGKPAIIDTLIFTHHGPVSYTNTETPFNSVTPVGHALRWSAHDASNELLTLYKFNKAKNYSEWVEAASHWSNPAQNFVMADQEGTIALRVSGMLPKRWKEQGKFISDGSKKAYEWGERIPFSQNPQSKNPKRGFVSSANQFPALPDRYPYYLDWEFASFERGARINDRLHLMNGITIDSMRNLQMDSYSMLAELVLPTLLKNIDKTEYSGDKLRLLSGLAQWDYYNRASVTAPSVFNSWLNKLKNNVFHDDLKDISVMPTNVVFSDLIINEPQSKWIDDKSTDEIETLKMLVKKSFDEAVDEMTEQMGPVGDDWLWGNVNGAKIGHLARIPGLGEHVFVGGGRESVNAIRGNHGPSWRLVAQTGEEVMGYGIYPGGQSGNPGSPFYNNMTSRWSEGQLMPLVLKEQDVIEKSRYSIIFKKQ